MKIVLTHLPPSPHKDEDIKSYEKNEDIFLEVNAKASDEHFTLKAGGGFVEGIGFVGDI